MAAAQALYIGIMTGTSLDGLDAVLADFSHAAPRILASAALPYPAPLRAEMLALQGANDGQGLNELHRSRVAAIDLAALHANAVQQLLAEAKITASAVQAVGAHGQTVRHAPHAGAHSYTVQLLDAARLAEACGIRVITDFRARDIAAGGQGAPLVPAFHAGLLRPLVLGNAKPAALCNIGGFANLTLLRSDGSISGSDTGPGNVLMDAWIQRHQGKPYDAGGLWAAQGKVNEPLLARLLAHPFFACPFPKSTGREAFNLAWLDAKLQNHPTLITQDVQATLCELTARSIAQALQHEPSNALYVCGGGAFNAHFMQRLAQLLPATLVRPSSDPALGVNPQHMEALAFAWLARQCLLGLAGNVPAVTGAAGERVLGAAYAA